MVFTVRQTLRSLRIPRVFIRALLSAEGGTGQATIQEQPLQKGAPQTGSSPSFELV